MSAEAQACTGDAARIRFVPLPSGDCTCRVAPSTGDGLREIRLWSKGRIFPILEAKEVTGETGRTTCPGDLGAGAATNASLPLGVRERAKRGACGVVPAASGLFVVSEACETTSGEASTCGGTIRPKFELWTAVGNAGTAAASSVVTADTALGASVVCGIVVFGTIATGGVARGTPSPKEKDGVDGNSPI